MKLYSTLLIAAGLTLSACGDSKSQLSETQNALTSDDIIISINKKFFNSNLPTQETQSREFNTTRDGLNLRGTSTVTPKKLFVELTPSRNQAVFDVRYEATTSTTAIGSKRPARFNVSSDTSSNSLKRVTFDMKHGLMQSPSITNTRTRISISNVSVDTLFEIGRIAAERKLKKNANKLASSIGRSIATEIDKNLDETIAEKFIENGIDNLNKNAKTLAFDENVKTRIGSTSEFVNIAAKTGTSSRPVDQEPQASGDLSVAIHADYLAANFSRLFSNENLSSEEISTRFEEAMKLIKSLSTSEETSEENAEEREGFEMSFATDRPIDFSFSGDQAIISINATGFKTSSFEYNNPVKFIIPYTLKEVDGKKRLAAPARVKDILHETEGRQNIKFRIAIGAIKAGLYDGLPRDFVPQNLNAAKFGLDDTLAIETVELNNNWLNAGWKISK